MKFSTMMGAATVALLLAACGDTAEEAIEDTSPADTAAAAPASAGLSGWTTIGDSVWMVEGQEIVATGAAEGMSFLATEESYTDFNIRLEFMLSNPGNSGVFFRCEDIAAISDTSCYEANIFDDRPDQSGRTGGIPNIAAPAVEIDGQDGAWHSYDITAQGDHIVVVLDGETTVDVIDATHTTPSPIAIQIGPGENTLRLRNVEVTRF